MSAVPPRFSPPDRLLLGPGPSPVDPRILEAMARPTIGHLDSAFLRMMDEIRSMLRVVFRTENELTLPISGTGSAGMEACLTNLIEPGDEVLVLENGLFGARMADIVQRCRGELRTLRAPWGEGFGQEQVETALQGKKTKIVALVHAETSTGYRQDVPAIARVAHDHGALLVLDAVTSLGGIPVELDEWGVDAAYSGTQKCLGCPPGLAPISFGPRAETVLASRRTKPASWYLDLSMVRRYWNEERVYHHTAPINALYGLHEALRIVAVEGLEARWKRHEEAGDRFARGIEEMGLEMLVAPAHRLPQLNSVRIPEGKRDETIRKAMLDGHGIEIGGGLGELKGKIWRVGLMGSAAQPEVVDRVLTALGMTLR
ncbi:MAG: alanine--glyoxylate aminotransferase family protein [Planctomycetota bacterium]|nr:alanine--glyoxylate aminotransferase family protein [Planctomycetota bacterium]